jgi:hypothetical protein
MNHEEPDHGNCGPTSSGLLIEFVNVSGQDDGHNDMARSHADSTNYQYWLATNTIDVQDRGNGRDLGRNC